jgi:hypothetical protein
MQAATLLFGCAQTVVPLAIAIPLLTRAKRSHAWPAVEATIVESTLVPRRNQSACDLRVTYAYTVDGRSYESRRLAVGPRFPVGRRAGARAVARFAAGSRVAAAVDPVDPSYSVLERGARPALIAVVALCVFVALVGAVQLILQLIAATGLIPLGSVPAT